ncbi:MAG: ribosome biogenesis GTP-binding protein YihA/YsxC [Rikenellaceae bacterium]|nr:ribosome biogenesis GTP-binding protein YihA/YsxC [Rikenellaceae bacterium]
MNVTSAVFDRSSQKVSQIPSGGLPEFAFIGRSNVGKSSLINMLTGRPTLAKVSGTPGKTRLINHFLINDSWYLVDLPGYGYARVSKADRQGFSQLITGYIRKSPSLVFLFVLVDSRHEPQKIDLEFINFLGENSIPFGIVFTKADKLGPGKVKTNIETYGRKLLETWEELPPMFVTSSEKKQGRDEILGFIDQCLTDLHKGEE